MSSTNTTAVPEQMELASQTKELLQLCKRTTLEYGNVKTAMDNLDRARLKQRNSKANRTQHKSLCIQAMQEAERHKSTLINALEKISHIRNLEHKIRLSMGPKSFRRGVLMSVLQENAKSVPLWIGKAGEAPPPLCGAIPASNSTVANPGDHVAALVPEPDVAATACNLSEGCILAEVVSYDAEKMSYQVEDVDAEEGKMRYTLPRSKVLPLPKWKANPVTHPEAIFKKGTIHDEYSLYFEDSSYPEGYAPAIRIPQRYVIEYPDKESVSSNHNTSSRKRTK